MLITTNIKFCDRLSQIRQLMAQISEVEEGGVSLTSSTNDTA